MSQAIVTAFVLCLLYECCHLVAANPDAKRLYDDLLRKRKYNKLMRPVQDHNNKLNVTINLKLSQLIDVVSALAFALIIIRRVNLVAVGLSVRRCQDRSCEQSGRFAAAPC